MDYRFLDGDIEWQHYSEKPGRVGVNEFMNEGVDTVLLNVVGSDGLQATVSESTSQNGFSNNFMNGNDAHGQSYDFPSSASSWTATPSFEFLSQPSLHTPPMFGFEQNKNVTATGFNVDQVHMATPNSDLLQDFCGHDVDEGVFADIVMRQDERHPSPAWPVISYPELPTPRMPLFDAQTAEPVLQHFNGTAFAPNPGPPHATPSFHPTTTTPLPASTSNICAVQSTDNPRMFIFCCTAPRCRRRTFGRWYDFSRHYNGAHAIKKTAFWCPVPDCDRSEGEGNRSFPRKDKMMSHAMKVHEIEEGDARLVNEGDARFEVGE